MAKAFANAIAASSSRHIASSLACSFLLCLARVSSSSCVKWAEHDSISILCCRNLAIFSAAAAFAFSHVDVTELAGPFDELLVDHDSNNKLFNCSLASFNTLSRNSLHLAAISSSCFQSSMILPELTLGVNSCTDKSVNLYTLNKDLASVIALRISSTDWSGVCKMFI